MLSMPLAAINNCGERGDWGWGGRLSMPLDNCGDVAGAPW